MAWNTSLYPVSALLTVLWITKTVGNLSIVPKHTIAKLGDRVELECSNNGTTSDPSEAPNETNPLEWKFSAVISDEDEVIYQYGYINRKFISKYTTDNGTGGKCNLIMKAVDLTFAGTYTCCEPYLFGEDEHFCVSAELIVIESDPICNTNQSASLSDMTEDDYIQMWCTVNYSGNLIPVMEWTMSNGRTVDAEIVYVDTSTTVTSSLITQLTSNDSGVTFTCKTSFKSMTNFSRTMKPGEAVATNIPQYQHLWNFTANVLSKNSSTYRPDQRDVLVAIAGIIVGALIIFVVIATIIFKVCKRGKARPDVVPVARQNSHDVTDRPQLHQSPPLYAEVQRNSNGFRIAEVHPLPVYSLVKNERIVDDPNDQSVAKNYSQTQNNIPVYAEVKKPQKENKTTGITGQTTFPADEKPKQNFTGADGTRYEEMSSFSEPNSALNRVPIKRPPMFCLVETYASIDHTVAPPPPPLVLRRH